MAQFNISSSAESLKIEIEGPKDGYSFSYNVNFTSAKSISFSLILEKPLLGNGQETLKMQFVKPFFQSKEGVNLYKNTLTTPIYAKSVASAAVEQGGTATTGILGVTIGTIIMTNVLL